MPTLRERTRRLLTTFLFLTCGPGLLAFVGYRLYWRTTSAALELEKGRLAAATRFDVAIERREFLRPNVRRLTGVVLSTPKTAEAALFCPELYEIRATDDGLLREFARSFDKRSKRVLNVDDESASSREKSESNREVDSDPDSDPDSDAKADAENAPETLEKLLFSDVKSNETTRTLVVAPVVYCRDSQILAAKNAFCDEFFRRSGLDAFPTSGAVLALVVERVVFQDDSDFERTRREFVAPTAKRSNDELTGALRTAALLTDRGAANASETSARLETVAFAAQEPIVEKFRALCVATPRVKRADALFELAKISAARPTFLSLETRREPGVARFAFDAARSSTPGTFAARFFPIFNFLGRESRLCGAIVASDAPEFATDVFPTRTSPTSDAAADAIADEAPFLTKEPPVWTTRLDEFHLSDVDVETLVERLDLPRFVGSVSDFYVRRGAVRRGVFLGSGSLKAVQGAFPQAFLSRLCASGRLEVAPATPLSLRFANDAVPFAELEFLFELRADGVAFDSAYRNKIVAYYKSGDVRYGFFLPKDVAGRVVPYAEPIRALFASQDGDAFWSPLLRDALNHLPLEKPGPETRPPSLP